jgi:hypothetical protein
VTPIAKNRNQFRKVAKIPCRSGRFARTTIAATTMPTRKNVRVKFLRVKAMMPPMSSSMGVAPFCEVRRESAGPATDPVRIGERNRALHARML